MSKICLFVLELYDMGSIYIFLLEAMMFCIGVNLLGLWVSHVRPVARHLDPKPLGSPLFLVEMFEVRGRLRSVKVNASRSCFFAHAVGFSRTVRPSQVPTRNKGIATGTKGHRY